MTDERAGQLNEPNLVEAVVNQRGCEWEKLGIEWPHVDVAVLVSMRAMASVMVKRGLINELGIEILKRDGVIPPVSPDHNKP
jgi:hypothetical protein